MPFESPESWIQVVSNVVMLVYIFIMSQRLSGVHGQVRNEHPKQPNMRHQLDGIEDKLDSIGQRVEFVQTELHNESDRSIKADRKIEQRIDASKGKTDR